MNFTKKELSIWCLGFILLTTALGMTYLNAQTAGGPQPTATVAGDPATPTPHQKHKKNGLGQKVVGEGTPPGYPANVEPTTSITQVTP